MGELSGRTAFVTGAASGIGRASALALANAGANVMAADIDGAGLEETLGLLRATGADAEVRELDVADADAVAAAVRATVARFGGLHLAHNNAGVLGPIGPLADIPIETARALFDVNVFGVLNCMQAQIRHMVGAGGGSIVNTASVSGVHAVPHIGAYTATKHAVIGLTRAAAADYSAQGIRVNCVCPGYVMTGMTQGKFDAPTEAALMAQHPIGRFARPEEVAEAALWLLGDKASFSTGSALFVDGGQTI